MSSGVQAEHCYLTARLRQDRHTAGYSCNSDKRWEGNHGIYNSHTQMKQGKRPNPEGLLFFLSVVLCLGACGKLESQKTSKNSGSLLAEKGIEKLQENELTMLHQVKVLTDTLADCSAPEVLEHD